MVAVGNNEAGMLYWRNEIKLVIILHYFCFYKESFILYRMTLVFKGLQADTILFREIQQNLCKTATLKKV